MNKMTVLFVIALVVIVYFAFDKFISIDSSDDINSINSSEIDYTVIKPPTFTKKSDDDNEQDGLGFVQKSREEELEKNTEGAKSQRLAKRKELIEFYNSKNKNYDTLGNVLEKLQSNSKPSGEMKNQVERLKHNLSISKKVASLSKNLYYDVDGDKEFDHSVLDEIIKLQNQLIVPSGLLDFSAVDNND